MDSEFRLMARLCWVRKQVKTHQRPFLSHSRAIQVGRGFGGQYGNRTRLIYDRFRQGFTKALDILVGAQSEQQIDHQHRQSGIGWKKRSDLLEKGESMFAALGVAANRRLFREESNEQRSRPNDLQQTMGWSRS